MAACADSETIGGTPAKPPPEPPPLADVRITLDPGTRRQTMTGWEAHAQSGQENPAFPVYKDRLFDLAVGDLGINRLRLEIWSGAENTRDWWSEMRAGRIDATTWRCFRFSTVNDNDDPLSTNPNGFQFQQLDHKVENVVLPIKARLEARGERLYLNVNYVGFTRQICDGLDYTHDDSPEEYAEFALATLQHLRTKYGLVPDAWEMILEPDNTAFWRGRTIGEALVATAARFRADGFQPAFIAPSTTNMGNAVSYFDAMALVPGALQSLSDLSYHRYSGVSTGNLQAIANRAAQHGLRTAMLEHIGSGHEDLHQDLKVGANSAWQQFTLAFPESDNGAQYYLIDLSNPANPQIKLARRTRFLRQYFRYIRLGAVRIGATTTDDAFDPLAFVNPDGKLVVVVKAGEGGAFSVLGFPAGTYGVQYTTSDESDAPASDVTVGAGGALTTQIPESGVLTVFAK
jgi:hypothetical protein